MKKTVLVLALALAACGADRVAESPEAHYTMDYIDGGQVPVPPEAISPFEQKDVTYVSEPILELDSDWNMDVKLFSKYRYTNEFVEKWRAKYGYTPTLPVMTPEEFFAAIDLDRPGLEEVKTAVSRADWSAARDAWLAYQATRERPWHLKARRPTEEAGRAAVKTADEILADPSFPACRPGTRFSLWGLMRPLETAYLHTGDAKYARGWLTMFTHWYETYRPPAQRPKMYISFAWMPYWRTLAAGSSARTLCESERWLAEAEGLDPDSVFKVYQSILEHARYLRLVNDVYLPSNWQTAQCLGLMKIGTYFPAFRRAPAWREHAWRLACDHMVRETFDDGTHCENSVGYAVGVIDLYRDTVRLARSAGMPFSEEARKRWRSMYFWAAKILPPTGSYVPCGDNGIGAEGSLVKRAIIPGALEFPDPVLKYFASRYPEEVRRTAEEEFENTAEVLAAYDEVVPEEPPFTSVLLPDTGWAVMRESFDTRSGYLFLDYGRDEAWHSHPDFGSFNLWAFGRPLVVECGRTGPYEADVSKRWYKQTIAHNTVMVDARSMRKCVDNRLNRWWSGGAYDFADATSDGYRWIGVLHHRRVLFVKPDYFLITDFLPGPAFYGTSFQTSGYHEFDWLAHFQPTRLEIDAETKRIDTRNDDANVALVPLNAGEIEVRESVGPTSTPEGAAEAPYVSLHREGMAFVQFQVLLLPYEGGERPGIGVTALQADETDRVHRKNVGYEIALLGRKDVLLEAADPRKIAAYGDWEFRGAFAHVRDAGSREARFFLVEADRLARGGVLLFSSPDPVGAVEFAVTDGVLEVETNSDVEGVKVYAPGVTRVTVGGREHGFAREDDLVVLE